MHILLEIDALRRFFILEKRQKDQLFNIFHRIFDQALKQSFHSGAQLTIQDQSKSDVDIDTENLITLNTINIGPLKTYLKDEFRIDRKHHAIDVLVHLLEQLHREIVRRDQAEELQ